MICPYRKQTKTYIENDVQVTSDYYMECYGTECPYYVAERQYSNELIAPAYCNRAELKSEIGVWKGGAE